MTSALIFNIQKFCLHDGPGIRTTVFFKGCPLGCHWCHNPESQKYQPEILFNPEKCRGCGACTKACPAGAVSIYVSEPLNFPDLCQQCELCLDHCVHSARELAGRHYSVSQLLQEIEKDRPFYEESGGGVTLSGGEVLSQIDFAAELAAECKSRGIHVAIDTCGHAPFTSFERLLGVADLFLYDMKIQDPTIHLRYTGRDNYLILRNLRRLAATGAEIALRLPLMAGLNDSDMDVAGIISLCHEIRPKSVHLLPYHDMCRGKYGKLNGSVNYRQFKAPAAERLEEIKEVMQENGLTVSIGG